MPYGGYFDDYYKNIIKPVIEINSFSVIRADEIYSSGAIIDDIYKQIMEANICIADVTGKNPNVNYELGLAHALNKPTIIISQKIDDIPFDYKHLRAIIYDPRSHDWSLKLQLSLINTLKNIRKNPNDSIVFKPIKTDGDKAIKHLINILFDLDCEIEKNDEHFCDENYNVLIKTQWKIKTKSSSYHLCYNLVTERSYGKIEILKVHDLNNGRDLEYITIERGEKHLSFLLLLNDFKRPGQQYIIETEVFVEGYLDGLSKERPVRMGHQATKRSKIKYSHKTEKYYFPKSNQFKYIKAEYINHPDHNLIGQVVNSYETNDHYILDLQYGNGSLYSQETGSLIGF
jgi:hypothetical protein